MFPKPDKCNTFHNISDFTIIDTLGKGGYSTVYLVEHKKSKKRYALKACDRVKKDRDRSDKAYNEIAILQRLDHPNIIKIKGWFEDSSTVYLVLEHISGKDCSKYFKDNLPSKSELRRIMTQLVSAVKYIHDKNIIHRDIKLENILIDSKGNIKLGDFGLCGVKKDKYDMFQQKMGTVRYSAPELLSGQQYNDSIDIWGIGICFYLLLTGKYPFDGSTKENITRRILEKTLHYSKLKLERKEVKLLKVLLEKNPENRIEIEDILDSSFFNCSKR